MVKIYESSPESALVILPRGISARHVVEYIPEGVLDTPLTLQKRAVGAVGAISRLPCVRHARAMFEAAFGP